MGVAGWSFGVSTWPTITEIIQEGRIQRFRSKTAPFFSPFFGGGNQIKDETVQLVNISLSLWNSLI